MQYVPEKHLREHGKARDTLGKKLSRVLENDSLMWLAFPFPIAACIAVHRRLSRYLFPDEEWRVPEWDVEFVNDADVACDVEKLVE